MTGQRRPCVATAGSSVRRGSEACIGACEEQNLAIFCLSGTSEGGLRGSRLSCPLERLKLPVFQVGLAGFGTVFFFLPAQIVPDTSFLPRCFIHSFLRLPGGGSSRREARSPRPGRPRASEHCRAGRTERKRFSFGPWAAGVPSRRAEALLLDAADRLDLERLGVGAPLSPVLVVATVVVSLQDVLVATVAWVLVANPPAAGQDQERRSRPGACFTLQLETDLPWALPVTKRIRNTHTHTPRTNGHLA